MNSPKIARIALIGILALGLVALAGCAVKGGTNDQPAQRSADAANQSTDNPSTSEDGTMSTAIVAYANGDDVLFVDQETQTPYIPTHLDDAVITFEGQRIDEDDLQAGNIVTVIGNGVMLESFPGQYPGITSVEVTSVGDPTDAEQYADIVDSVFGAPDQSQVPSGSLDYTTSDAQVSVILNPYEFEWRWQTDDGQTSQSEIDGSATNPNGEFTENVADARISGSVNAFIAFSVNPTSVEIERTPLADGQAKIDPRAEDMDVPCTIGDDGAIALTIEPGFLYELNVTFPQGEADYAFCTMS